MRRAERWLPWAALLLAGCAAPWGGEQEAAAPPFRDPALTVERAAQAITVGQSEKREVEARLGPAERLAFASGYEVWVYRAPAQRRPRQERQEADRPELVILFDPRGTVSKLRARPP